MAIKNYQISKCGQGKYKEREPQMSDSEIITILIFFHLKSFRNLKHFYLYYVKKPDQISVISVDDVYLLIARNEDLQQQYTSI
ncbi:MAG: hypothetical protein JXC36_09725 [Candidatus Atribacteria bacterium]|nr:hypothetical protein [Candidatus Atribacteria bacterium]